MRFTHSIHACAFIACFAFLAPKIQPQAVPITCGTTVGVNAIYPLSFRLNNSGDCNINFRAYSQANQQGSLILDVVVPAGLSVEVNAPQVVPASFSLAAFGSGAQGVLSVSPLVQNSDPVAQHWARLGDDIVNANIGNVGIGTQSAGAKLAVAGVIASTLGGFGFPDGTTQTTAASGSVGVPKGAIVMWSGTLANIPTGWALCNGSNGTPNLLDRFVLGVSGGENPGATGGANSHTHSTPAHQHQIPAQTADLPQHTHTLPSQTVNLPDHTHTTTIKSVTTQNASGTTGVTSGSLQVASSSHTHNISIPALTTGNPNGFVQITMPASVSGLSSFLTNINIPAQVTAPDGGAGATSSSSNVPEYYKLAFIQKL